MVLFWTWNFFLFYLLVLEGTGQKYSNINTALTGIYKSDERLLGMMMAFVLVEEAGMQG